MVNDFVLFLHFFGHYLTLSGFTTRHLCAPPQHGVSGQLLVWKPGLQGQGSGEAQNEAHGRHWPWTILLQRVGGGRRCWHWVSSKPNWENMKMVTIWSLLVTGGEAGRWSAARAPTAATPAQAQPSLVPLPFCHTSQWPSEDPVTHLGWPLSKWHFQIMGWSTEAGPCLCSSVFIK